MTERVYLQPAYVLHRRPYRETSLIIQLFTKTHGLVSVLARGVRGTKAKNTGLYEPFVPLLVSWSGRSDLMTLTQTELSGTQYTLGGRSLVTALYLNELLIKLIKPRDPHEAVFLKYQDTLAAIANDKQVQLALRCFEKALLAEIGYGLTLTETVEGESVSEFSYYRFEPNIGLIYVDSEAVSAFSSEQRIFSGKSLLAFDREEADETKWLDDAKRLARLAIETRLEGKRINARRMYVSS